MMLRLNFLLAFLFVALISCSKKANIDPANKLHSKYRLIEVTTDRPVDVNYDGEFNTDLKLELPGLENMLLSTNEEISYVNILWVEPRVNEGVLYEPLPTTYDENDDIKYLPVQNLIYYRREDDILTLTTRAENYPSRYYTFSAPHKLTIESNGRVLSFVASQEFLTKDGVQTFRLNVSYAPEEVAD